MSIYHLSDTTWVKCSMLLIKSFSAAPSLPVENANVYFVHNLGTDFVQLWKTLFHRPSTRAKYVFSKKISFYDKTWLGPSVRLYGLWRQDLVKSLLQKSMVPKLWGKLIGWRILDFRFVHLMILVFRFQDLCIWWFLFLGPESAGWCSGRMDRVENLFQQSN